MGGEPLPPIRYEACEAVRLDKTKVPVRVRACVCVCV